MPKESNYPKGKKKTIKVDINIDFEKQMKEAINKARKPYWIDNKNKETETEYIQRIQSMHLEKCSNEALIDLKSKENGK